MFLEVERKRGRTHRRQHIPINRNGCCVRVGKQRRARQAGTINIWRISNIKNIRPACFKFILFFYFSILKFHASGHLQPHRPKFKSRQYYKLVSILGIKKERRHWIWQCITTTTLDIEYNERLSGQALFRVTFGRT